jgi:acyl-CoA reductase-like NAD-dependent aldehyde dehydrogenase
MTRVPVRKTYKLYLGGAFPRSESGRTYEAEEHNIAQGSRKDLRDAVRAARGAFGKWAAMTAYNRGQVLYRVAEMMEARTAELAELCEGREEVERSIDRVVWYAGWTDKLAQVLGGANPVAGPYFNFTMPEPTGVVGIVAPAEPALLGLVSRLSPVLAGGNVAVVIASEAHPRAAIEFAEVLATSDMPGGVVNVLTGLRDELAPHLASHLDVDALDLDRSDAELERAAADNVKRVVSARDGAQSPYEISSFLELKTVWHPMGQ